MGAAREISGSRERFPIERSRAGVTPARLVLFYTQIRRRGEHLRGEGGKLGGRILRRAPVSGCDGPIRPSFVRSRACAFGPGFSRQRVAFVIGWHGCVRFLSACRYCTAEERFFPGMCGRPLSVRPRRTGPAGRRNECRFCPVVIVLVPVCGRDKSCGGKGLRQARSRPVFALLSG